MADLNRKRIPSSGELLPVVGLGTWQTFDVGVSRTERAPLEEVLKAFVERGGKVVDSSPMYGRSEKVLGEIAASTGLREKLFLADKVWTQGKSAGISQMEESLRLLKTPRIDLMQVHNLLDAETHLATLREWKKAGRIRYIGITHYTESGYPAVEKLLKTGKLDFLQINYSVAERESAKRLLPLAADRGVAALANRPLGGGELIRRLLPHPLPAFAAEIGCNSWAQLLLKYVVSHPAVTCAIPGTSKVKHLQDNMQAAMGTLPDEAMRLRIQRAILSS